MNKIVLDISSLDKFIEANLKKISTDDDELNLWIDECKNYCCAIWSNSYFLARNIHVKTNKQDYSQGYINNVYQLKEEMFFELNEIDSDFIDYILHFVSKKEEDEMENRIKELQYNYVNNIHGKKVRD